MCRILRIKSDFDGDFRNRMGKRHSSILNMITTYPQDNADARNLLAVGCGVIDARVHSILARFRIAEDGYEVTRSQT